MGLFLLSSLVIWIILSSDGKYKSADAAWKKVGRASVSLQPYVNYSYSLFANDAGS